MLVKQNKNEYSIFFYGQENNIMGISKTISNCKPYTGKFTSHTICLDCGKIIGRAMGGFLKHSKSCANNSEEWAKSEIQRLFDKDNWSGLSIDEKSMLNYLIRMTNFKPKYNCPA